MDIKEATKPINPLEIYESLDRKSGVSGLRDVQIEILKRWFTDRQNEKDSIIKLHTGVGKTLIGLLVLQSKLNSDSKPCLYVASTKHLAKQVCDEAERFGIPVCYLESGQKIPSKFESGSKILITYAHMLFNGKTIFGLENNSTIPNAIVLDDVHSCLDVIREAFTIKIERNKHKNLYCSILKLFSEELEEQRPGNFLNIKDGESTALMQIPYWTMRLKLSNLRDLIKTSQQQVTDIDFAWNLLFNDKNNLSCYISGKEICITPYRFSVEPFRTFSRANTRILMTATTQDDSAFIANMGIAKEAILNPLISHTQKWAGEKMIIIPSQIDEYFNKKELVESLLQNRNKNFGVVGIVPSNQKADEYAEVATEIQLKNANSKDIKKVDIKNIEDETKNLITGKFDSIYFFINKYDGIDLPDRSCRVLILDSKPFFNNLPSRNEELCREDSGYINKKLAQKIEQGMGRGVRGEKDYCAILVFGSDLVRFLRNKDTANYFSEQTRKQIEIGFSIAKQAQNEITANSNSSVVELLNQFLRRESVWKSYYNSEMSKITIQEPDERLYSLIETESDIDDLYYSGNHKKAVSQLQEFIDSNFTENENERGWFLQKLARYYDSFNPGEAQKIQQAAFTKNCNLLRSTKKVEYSKRVLESSRHKNILTYVRKFSNKNDFLRQMDEYLDNLAFGVPSELFEAGLGELGLLLGYDSTRPDKENGFGPDNLWVAPNNNYFLFECKNQVKQGRNEISGNEVGQMDKHIAWFRNLYKEAVLQSYMIIPINKLSKGSYFSEEVGVIRPNRLKILVENARRFANSLYENDTLIEDKEQIFELLKNNNLNESDFQESYSEHCLKRSY